MTQKLTNGASTYIMKKRHVQQSTQHKNNNVSQITQIKRTKTSVTAAQKRIKQFLLRVHFEAMEIPKLV